MDKPELVCELVKEVAVEEGRESAIRFLALLMHCMELHQDRISNLVAWCTDPARSKSHTWEPWGEIFDAWNALAQMLKQVKSSMSLPSAIWEGNVAKLTKEFEQIVSHNVLSEHTEKVLEIALALRGLTPSVHIGSSNSLLRTCGYRLSERGETLNGYMERWLSRLGENPVHGDRSAIDEVAAGIIKRYGTARLWEILHGTADALQSGF